MDQVTLKRIALAHPAIRQQLLDDYTYANNKLLGKGVRLRFAYVVRTNKEQDGLYALGRTVVNPNGKSSRRPFGSIVTNAKGGQSIHNYALAFDIVLLYDTNCDGVFNEASWDMNKDGDHDGKADWTEMYEFFKSKGWEWGGDWKSFRDYPHFQKSYGYGWRELKAMVAKGEYVLENGIQYVKL
jgi:peptidoglycan L-alanyl-D-glutamate endopeptidase CwlK